MIGKVKIPYKVACFTWLLAREAVLTQDNLLKRGYQLGSRCHLCEAQEETVNHLFLHCRVTDQLWKIFINLRGIQCLMLGRIKEVLTSWKRDGDHSRQKERWKIVPACIWWTIWKERNQRCFEDNHSSIQKLKMSCLMLFYFGVNRSTQKRVIVFLMFQTSYEPYSDLVFSSGTLLVIMDGYTDLVQPPLQSIQICNLFKKKKCIQSRISRKKFK